MDTAAPPWERPRRFEAYPQLRTRAGLPAIPRIVLYAGVVGLIALALFLVPGFFLGGDQGSANPSASASAGASGSPLASEGPTAIPQPTPIVYIVKPADTISKIARKYGVTVKQILAANPKITDPNKIKVNDQILIPVPEPTEDPGTGEEESPSP